MIKKVIVLLECSEFLSEAGEELILLLKPKETLTGKKECSFMTTADRADLFNVPFIFEFWWNAPGEIQIKCSGRSNKKCLLLAGVEVEIWDGLGRIGG